MNEPTYQIRPNRPNPIYLKGKLLFVSKKTEQKPIISRLISGEEVVIEDRFHTGMNILAALKKELFGKKDKRDFTAYRETRSQFYHASNRLLVPVRNNKIDLKKSPEIGWLKILYPDVSEFYLSFPQIQGLNSSWQWYLKGIRYPGLKERIHPYYGTYFPTRFDHLRLFDNWLKSYEGSKQSAIDIGTGCGVLAFQMHNRGFNYVTASDINPNAIISVREHAEKFEYSGHMDLFLSDLFEEHHSKADLIVFNPPWLPAQKDIEGLDSAIYYEPGLFKRFFEQAGEYLEEDGRLVVLFSNLGEKVGVTDHHPVRWELENHARFRNVRLLRKKVKKSSRKTRRRDHRKNEYVELWELTC